MTGKNGQPPLPLGRSGQRIRNLRQMAKGITPFLLALHEEHGDIARYDLPGGRNCVVFSAELMEEVLARESEFPPDFPSSPHDVMKSPGLVRTRGEAHPRLTELMSAAFAPERMRGYARILAEQVRKHCGRLEPGGTIDLIRTFERLTWDATFGAAIGPDLLVDATVPKPITDALKLKLTVASMPAGALLLKLPLPFLRRALRAAKELDVQIYQAIRRAGGAGHPGDDIVSFLARAHERGVVDWSFANEERIRDQVYSLLFPGYEAPLMVLVPAAHYLAANPAARERLEEEADQVLGDRPVAGEDFERLPYAQAVCQELLRVEPVAVTLLPRRALADTTLAGYSIPRGTIMQIAAQVIHTRPDYWDHASELRPERWLEDTPQTSSGCPVKAYLPFSREPRFCRGAHFATVLIVLALAEIARRYRIEPVDDGVPPRTSMDIGFFTGPLLAKVSARRGAPGGEAV